jgi:hypothetical protein
VDYKFICRTIVALNKVYISLLEFAYDLPNVAAGGEMADAAGRGVAGYVSGVGLMISTEQRRALEMLAEAEARGSTIEMLIENGFPAGLLSDLVSDGLATMQGDTVKVGGRAIEIIGVQITDAGQRAIEKP